MISESKLLQHIESQPHKAAGFKQLLRELSLRGGERRELEKMLKELVGRGRLVVTAKERYAFPSEAVNRNIVIGTLHMHRDGYGFVRPTDPTVRQQFEGDIFISPTDTGAAMHGDQVLIELTSRSRERRAEGRVVRIMQRAHGTVVGIFHYGQRHNYVRPIDEKITMDVIIPQGQEIIADKAEYVDDAADSRGRKGKKKPKTTDRVIGSEARVREWEDLEGLVVDVEITEWPTASHNPRGRVVEVLGYEDDFGVDVEIIIRKHHLPHQFPPDAIAQAEAIEPIINAQEMKRRRDFRKLPIVTIDGETARDFDDAVFVRRLGDGHWELQVHIADVAHYVKPNSAIDLEAQIRGTSVYFPDRAIPMLPVELSTDICSLRPKVDRLVMSCVMQLDPAGEIVSYEIMPGVIRSAERMTYNIVQAILDGDEVMRERYAPLVENFLLMEELAKILNAKRDRRGSIDFDLPEPVIEFDAEGMMKGVTRSERLFAHRLIEEFMLAANETVATYLEEKRIASVYRIHEPPEAKRVYDFENLAAAFGYSLGVGALPVERHRMKADHRSRYGTGTRAKDVERPKAVMIKPQMYQKLTEKIAGKPEERILSYLMLRSLAQAKYSEMNEGHFALAATTYTHFTSPIRRYPDLLVHRVLKQVLASDAEVRDGDVGVGVGGAVVQGRNARWDEDPRDHRKKERHTREPLHGPIPEEELHNMAEDASMAERRADAAERELVEWKKVKFMVDRVGEDFDGLIVSITKFGMFVELTDLFVEGLVPLQSMHDDRYNFHENTRQLIGQRSRKTYSLGDRVRVIVDRVDRIERKINFSLLEEQPTRANRRRKRREY